MLTGNTSRQGNFKCQPQIPPRLRRKSEGERRERKPRDPSGRGPRGSLKSGSGSGGEIGDENWETTSEASEQEEKEHEDDRNNEASRRNFNQNRGNSRRQSQPNRQLSDVLGASEIKLAYYAYIQSMLSFGNIAWGGAISKSISYIYIHASTSLLHLLGGRQVIGVYNR
ncbi:hypothetical protein J6590_012144 [Homalodisca vitripennis]|nr:hypothetical protein J6590_012144 [Homalodisca vitripennis]